MEANRRLQVCLLLVRNYGCILTCSIGKVSTLATIARVTNQVIRTRTEAVRIMDDKYVFFTIKYLPSDILTTVRNHC
jgi:hypothetical protein